MASTSKLAVEVTSAAPSAHDERRLVMVAVTSMADASTLFAGLNMVMSPVPAGIAGSGHGLRRV